MKERLTEEFFEVDEDYGFVSKIVHYGDEISTLYGVLCSATLTEDQLEEMRQGGVLYMSDGSEYIALVRVAKRESD